MRSSAKPARDRRILATLHIVHAPAARAPGSGAGMAVAPRAPNRRTHGPVDDSLVQKPPTRQEEVMNSEQIKGNWNQLKGKVREKWGKLTNDDVEAVQGRSEQLQGKLQERYGIAKEEAKKRVDEFFASFEADGNA